MEATTRPGRWTIDAAARRVEVALDDVDGDAPAELLALVDALRAHGAGGSRVIVRACPQMLAHTLYKAGLLDAGWLELASVRDEEPYG
ncbi:MAG: hypothetical protein R3B09_07745 [Nannocystaceae bacterium]